MRVRPYRFTFRGTSRLLSSTGPAESRRHGRITTRANSRTLWTLRSTSIRTRTGSTPRRDFFMTRFSSRLCPSACLMLRRAKCRRSSRRRVCVSRTADSTPLRGRAIKGAAARDRARTCGTMPRRCRFCSRRLNDLCARPTTSSTSRKTVECASVYSCRWAALHGSSTAQPTGKWAASSNCIAIGKSQAMMSGWPNCGRWHSARWSMRGKNGTRTATGSWKVCSTTRTISNSSARTA